jgi:hypothetical protein
LFDIIVNMLIIVVSAVHKFVNLLGVTITAAAAAAVAAAAAAAAAAAGVLPTSSGKVTESRGT